MKKAFISILFLFYLTLFSSGPAYAIHSRTKTEAKSMVINKEQKQFKKMIKLKAKANKRKERKQNGKIPYFAIVLIIIFLGITIFFLHHTQVAIAGFLVGSVGIAVIISRLKSLIVSSVMKSKKEIRQKRVEKFQSRLKRKRGI